MEYGHKDMMTTCACFLLQNMFNPDSIWAGFTVL